MYINTFKYTPEDVDCKLCTEYVKKFGCTACGCPWMAERIEAGVVSYAEVVRQTLRRSRSFRPGRRNWTNSAPSWKTWTLWAWSAAWA